MWRLRQENPEFEASLISDNHCRVRFDKRREPKRKKFSIVLPICLAIHTLFPSLKS